MTLILGLSYTRGLAMFFLLMPVIFARPVTECASWFLDAQRARVQSTLSG